MALSLFNKWLLSFDRKMKQNIWNVLLFIDNCTAHSYIIELSSIEVTLFTFKYNFYNSAQGRFKLFYKEEIIRHLVKNIENDKSSSMNILEAIIMPDKAWRSLYVAADYIKLLCKSWF